MEKGCTDTSMVGSSYTQQQCLLLEEEEEYFCGNTFCFHYMLGDEYDGDWDKGTKSGQGVMKYADGEFM